MWIAIPINLIMIFFVILLMGITKLWMFGGPTFERHMPAYSLHVMQELPPDKHVAKTVFNPYYGISKAPYDASGRTLYKKQPAAAAAYGSKPGSFIHNAPHKYSDEKQSFGQAAPAYRQFAPQPGAYNDRAQFL